MENTHYLEGDRGVIEKSLSGGGAKGVVETSF